jgi:hypothetical protein
VYLALLVKIFEAEEEFSAYDRDVSFVEWTGFELLAVSHILMMKSDSIPNLSMNLHLRTP